MPIKIHFKGDKSNAICPDCGLVSTTLDYRNMSIGDNVVVKNILVGVCDNCGQSVTTLPQSTPAIKRQYEKSYLSIEALLPITYIEILDMACMEITLDNAKEVRKYLLGFYIDNILKSPDNIEKVILQYEELDKLISKHDVPKKRISLKVKPKFEKEFNKIMPYFKNNKTKVLKALIAKIKEDILDKVSTGKNNNLDHIKSVLALSF